MSKPEPDSVIGKERRKAALEFKSHVEQKQWPSLRTVMLNSEQLRSTDDLGYVDSGIDYSSIPSKNTTFPSEAIDEMINMLEETSPTLNQTGYRNLTDVLKVYPGALLTSHIIRLMDLTDPRTLRSSKTDLSLKYGLDILSTHIVSSGTVSRETSILKRCLAFMPKSKVKDVDPQVQLNALKLFTSTLLHSNQPGNALQHLNIFSKNLSGFEYYVTKHIRQALDSAPEKSNRRGYITLQGIHSRRAP